MNSKTQPVKAPVKVGASGWFRGKDSNLRSRIQSPLPYLLATPEKWAWLLVLTQSYAKQSLPEDVTSDGWAALDHQMRAVLILVLVAATAACGAYRFPGEAPIGNGTVSGAVTVVPCAPVQPVTPPCGGRPAAGVEIDFSGNGTMVGTLTDPKGAYSVELAAGTWKVSFKGYLRIVSGPPTVTVDAGASVVANYVVDSGIRVAVSKEPSTSPHPPDGGVGAAYGAAGDGRNPAR